MYRLCSFNPIIANLLHTGILSSLIYHHLFNYRVRELFMFSVWGLFIFCVYVCCAGRMMSRQKNTIGLADKKRRFIDKQAHHRDDVACGIRPRRQRPARTMWVTVVVGSRPCPTQLDRDGNTHTRPVINSWDSRIHFVRCLITFTYFFWFHCPLLIQVFVMLMIKLIKLDNR